MVRLNRIYTRTGDAGTTGLGDGERLPKHHLRIASYGTVDELSAVLGLALAQGLPADHRDWGRAIQHDLFDVGADLCVPGRDDDKLRIEPAYTARLEQWLDEANEGLPALETFVLPGGEPAAAWMHMARTVCRRAERLVSELASEQGEAEGLNPELLKYLNRLSDLLFVMARYENEKDGEGDTLISRERVERQEK